MPFFLDRAAFAPIIDFGPILSAEFLFVKQPSYAEIIGIHTFPTLLERGRSGRRWLTQC